MDRSRTDNRQIIEDRERIESRWTEDGDMMQQRMNRRKAKMEDR